MARIDHPSLGPLEFDDQGVADSRFELGETEVELDIWFEEEVKTELLDAVAVLTARALELHQANLLAIRRDLAGSDPDSAALLHRNFHVRQFNAEELLQVFGTADPEKIDDDVYMNALTLRRIGAYPDAGSPYLIWDYGFDPNLSDHLVSVMMDLSGQITYLSLES